MRKSRLVALVGAGQLSRSCVTRLSGLPEQLGPVMAPSYRLASRLVNRIRAGFAVQRYEDFENCRTVLISVPDALVPKTVSEMAAAEMEWKDRVVLLLDSNLDSSELEPLANAGAAAGSLTPVRGFDHRYIVEGHRDAVKEARRLIHDQRSRVFEVQSERKALYLAALSFSTRLFVPLADAAVQCLRASGLNSAVASAIAERLFHKTLRSYLHAGRKSWSGPVAVSDQREMCRQIEALEALDPVLAQFFRASAALTLERFERDSGWLEPVSAPAKRG